MLRLQLLRDRLPQADAEVLDSVVDVDGHVARSLHPQVEKAVPRKELEHVFEEGDSHLAAPLAGAVQGELDPQVGLARLALDLCGAWHGRDLVRPR